MPDTATNPPLETFLSLALEGSHDFFEWLEITSDYPADAASVSAYIRKIVRYGYHFLPISVELLYTVVTEALRQSGITYDIPAAEKALVYAYAQELVAEDDLAARKKNKPLNYDQRMQKVHEHAAALTAKIEALKLSNHPQ